jgi:RecA-family ATPase
MESTLSQDETEEINFNLADGRKTNWIHRVGSVRNSKVTQVDWIHPGVIREGTVTMFVGLPGSGKSTYALKLGDAIANGRILLNHPHTQRPVLYLDRDGNAVGDVMDRMEWLRILDGGLLKYIGSNVEEDIPMPNDKTVVEWVNTLTQRPVFILDSLSKFLDGGDENSATDINKFWSKIDPLKRAGCSFILIHHAGKKGENTRQYRGSTAIEAGCDYMFEFSDESQSGQGDLLSTIKMTRFKARNKQPFGDKNSTMLIDIDPFTGVFDIGKERPKSKSKPAGETKTAPAADDIDVTVGMRTEEVEEPKPMTLVKGGKLF